MGNKMEHFNTKNMLIAVVGATLAAISLFAAVLIGTSKATEENAETARTCIENGGTWIQSDKNCLIGGN
jgi:type IV secretory pathway VirB10-like protein